MPAVTFALSPLLSPPHPKSIDFYHRELFGWFSDVFRHSVVYELPGLGATFQADGHAASDRLLGCQRRELNHTQIEGSLLPIEQVS